MGLCDSDDDCADSGCGGVSGDVDGCGGGGGGGDGGENAVIVVVADDSTSLFIAIIDS